MTMWLIRNFAPKNWINWNQQCYIDFISFWIVLLTSLECYICIRRIIIINTGDVINPTIDWWSFSGLITIISVVYLYRHYVSLKTKTSQHNDLNKFPNFHREHWPILIFLDLWLRYTIMRKIEFKIIRNNYIDLLPPSFFTMFIG